MAKFVKNVSIPDPKGYTISFVVGDDVPEWALAKIKNPRIIDEDLEDVPAEAEPVTEPVVQPIEEAVVEKAPTAPRKRAPRTTKAKTTEAEAE
nr:hypothetical protein [Rhodococcus sp. (in: high G+C Gram-positive bacteria)]